MRISTNAHALRQDLEQVEEWNEYGELQDVIGTVPNTNGPGITPPSKHISNLPQAPAQKPKPKAPEAKASASATPTPGISRTGSMIQIQEPDKTEPPQASHAMRQLGNEAAKIAGEKNKEKLAAAKAAQDIKAAEANKSAEDEKPVAVETKPTSTGTQEVIPTEAATTKAETTPSTTEPSEKKPEPESTVETTTEKLDSAKLDDEPPAPTPATEPEEKLAAARAAHEAAIPAEIQTTSTPAESGPAIKGIEDAAVVAAPAGTIEAPAEDISKVEESTTVKEEPEKEEEEAKETGSETTKAEVSESKLEDPKDGEKATESVVD